MKDRGDSNAWSIFSCVIVAVCVLLNPSTRSHAQVVHFDNSVLLAYFPREWVEIQHTIGSVAQLYYGTNANSLIPVTNAPARFRPAGPLWGQWIGGTRTLTGLAPGQLAVLTVRVWNTNEAPTYEQATDRSIHGPFFYEVKPSGLDPTNYFMFNFRAINHIGWRCEQLTNMPSFHHQPQSLTVARGQDVMLTATITNACLGQWRFNGNFVGRGDISAVLPLFAPFFYTNYLRITNVQPSHAGSYQFMAENYVGTITSQVVTLTVVTPPQFTSARYDNDAFAFHVSEETGRLVIIETAPDLYPETTWMPVFTNTAPFAFTNSTPADRQRFYRTVLQ